MSRPSPRFRLDALPEALHWVEGFPRPAWDLITRAIDNTTDAGQQQEAYSCACREWLELLVRALGGEYRLYERHNFFMVSFRDEEEVVRQLSWAEESRQMILDRLEGVGWVSTTGKHVLLDFEDEEDANDYVAFFYADPRHVPAHSGMCIKQGYVHVVLNTGSPEWTRTVVRHELSHNLLAHLPLPLWLDEGIAELMTETLAVPRHELNLAALVPTLHFCGLHGFWDGSWFTDNSDSDRTWYSLAKLLVDSLNRAYPKQFNAFLVTAHANDGGDGAAKAAFGASLGEFLSKILGPGDWGCRVRASNV